MMVVIANKLNNYINESDLQVLDYKSIVGYYPLSMCLNYIKEHDVDMLLIDLTAIKDIHNDQAWKTLSRMVSPDSIFVLHDISNLDRMTTSTLITSGIYNVCNTVQDIINFMENPNTYASAMRRLKQGPVAYGIEEVESKQGDYETWSQYQQDMMKNYLIKQKNSEFEPPKQKSVVGDQLKHGLIVMPILTVICTILFYLFERIVYSSVDAETALGKALYTKLPNLDFNLLMVVGLFLAALIFTVYYSVINAKIKRKQYTRGKFMIVSMTIYCLIFILDYHFFQLTEGLFAKLPNIASGDYLYTNFFTYNYFVSVVAIFTYYFEVIIANSKTIVFDKDLNQRLNLFEDVLAIILFSVVITPFAYYVSRAIAIEHNAYKFFEELYVSSNFMIIMAIIGVVVVVIDVLGYILKLDMNSKIEGVE